MPVCHEMCVNINHKFHTSLFADSGLLKIIDGAHLDCVVKNHPSLLSVTHLLPENVLVSGDDNIPGLTASPTGELYTYHAEKRVRHGFKRAEESNGVLLLHLLLCKDCSNAELLVV